jgi:hypothetical protein
VSSTQGRALLFVLAHHGVNADPATHNDSRDREYCEGCRIADELPEGLQRAAAAMDRRRA